MPIPTHMGGDGEELLNSTDAYVKLGNVTSLASSPLKQRLKNQKFLQNWKSLATKQLVKSVCLLQLRLEMVSLKGQSFRMATGAGIGKEVL